MQIKRAYTNQLRVLSRTYGVYAIPTAVLNAKLGIPPKSMPVRFKKLVLRNTALARKAVKSFMRIRTLGNIRQSAESRQSSNFNPNNFQ